MERSDLIPYAVAGGAALFVAHFGLAVLPVTLGGLPTSLVLFGGLIGAVMAAIRWL
jgi:hypothetical protein